MNGHDLIPTRRNLHFDLPAERISDWYQRCHYMSHWFNSKSIMAPVFERFIVQSIRDCAHEVGCTPHLLEQLKALIAQEAVHAREHRRYNRLIEHAGLPAKHLEQRWKKLFNLTLESRWVSNQTRLAATLMFEHHSAMAARDPWRSVDGSTDLEPGFQALWSWHGLEEMEHKSVALDLWRQCIPAGLLRYCLRTGIAILISLPFWYLMFDCYLRLIWADRRAADHLRGLWRITKELWGPRGLFFGNALGWLAYFKPGFDPWKEGDLALLKPLEKL